MKHQKLLCAELQTLESRRLLSINPFGGTAPAGFGLFDNGEGDCKSAAGANGTYLVAETLQTKHGEEIDLARYSSSGTPVGTPVALATASSVGAYAVLSLASNASGAAVLIYARLEYHGEDRTVVGTDAVQIAADGAIGQPRALSANGESIAANAATVAVDPAGDFFLAYESTDQAQSVSIASYDAAGQQRGTAFVAETVSDDQQSIIDLTLAARPDGSGVILAAAIDTFDGAEDGGNRYDLIDDVTSLTAVTHAHLNRVHSLAPSAIAVQQDGSFALAYRQVNSDFVPLFADSAIHSFIQRFNANGNPAGGYVPLAADSRAEQVAVTNLALSSGSYLAVIYTQHKNVGAEYLQALDDHFENMGSAVAVAEAPPEITLGSRIDTNLGVQSNGQIFLSYPTGKVFRFTQQAAAVDGSTLYAFGTTGNDQMSISRQGNSLLVIRGLATSAFNATPIEQLIISGMAGDDSITNDTALRATLDGGAGNDTIDGGSNADSIFGGDGNDRITANNGADTIYGNDGIDALFGNGGDDRLIGGADADSLSGGPGNDRAAADTLDRFISIERIA